jgi:hypothetical protein
MIAVRADRESIRGRRRYLFCPMIKAIVHPMARMVVQRVVAKMVAETGPSNPSIAC